MSFIKATLVQLLYQWWAHIPGLR